MGLILPAIDIDIDGESDLQHWRVAEAHGTVVKGQIVREFVYDNEPSIWKTLDGTLIKPAPNLDKLELVDAVPAQSEAIASLGGAIASITFRPVQSLTTAAFTVPAVGSAVTISVEDPTGFEAGDLISTIHSDEYGGTLRAAYFTITSVSGNAITAECLDRSEARAIASVGDLMPAGTDVSGQTRLPSAPAGTNPSKVELYVSAAPDHLWDVADASAPMHKIAISLVSGYPLALANIKTDGSEELDAVRRMGIHLGMAATFHVLGKDFDKVRLFSVSPHSYRPFIQAIFR